MKRPNFRSLFRFSVFLLGILSILATWWFHPAVAQINRNADQVLSASFDSTNSAVKVSFTTIDPCLAPNVAKSNQAISVAAAGAAQLVALASSQSIYACSAAFTLAGTAPTAIFQYGTGTNCATGTTNLTGTMAPTSGTELAMGWGGTVFKSAASNALCINLGGTSPSAQGVLTYVQQ